MGLPVLTELDEEVENKGWKNVKEGFTAEKREAKRLEIEAEREKRRLELKARSGETRSKIANEQHYPELKTGTNVQKIDVIIGKFIGQLIDENKGKGLLDVDYTNKEMVMRRKDQMSIIKEHIGLIKQLKDVRGMLAADDADGHKQNLQSAENMELIDEAKELLAKKGIKPDF